MHNLLERKNVPGSRPFRSKAGHKRYMATFAAHGNRTRVDCQEAFTLGRGSVKSRRTIPAGPNMRPAKMLYTEDERRRRDASRWTLVQGVLAPLQFAVFLVSVGLVLRYLATGEGLTAATVSIVVKTFVLYAIMITGSLWEHDVYGRYLFAPAFFWEDVVSMLVLACTPPISDRARYRMARSRGGQMFLALAAYVTYVINATQFVLKLRAARLGERARRAACVGPRRVRPHDRSRDHPHSATRTGLHRRSGPARARPARGVLRADRHHLAASQDPGCVLPRGRLAHLRASHPVGSGRDDLRRAAVRHRDHRGARPRRPRRRQCRTRPRRRATCWRGARTSGCCSWSAPARRRSSSWTCRGLRRGCPSAYAPRVRVLNYSGSGIETTFTQGEDACLASLVPVLPRRSRGERSLLVVGALADVVEDQFRRLFEELGIGPVRFLPPRRAAELPPVGAATRCSCWRSRSLPKPRGHSKSAAPAGWPLPSRSGVEGTTLWLQAAAAAWSTDPARFERVAARSARARDGRARSAIARSSPASACSSFPIPSSKCRWRASWRANWAWQLIEVGTPFLHREHLAAELALLPRGTVLSEGQDVERQLDRCRAARPDLVVCGLGPGQSAGSRGHDHQMVDRAAVHADPGLRAGRRSGRTVRPSAGAAHAAGGLSHATDALDI